MADDLSTVASLLKDTNKKLDKLHSDNEQNDTKGDIIKGALPEILADTINTQLNIGTINDRQKEEKDRDVRQMNADEKAADNQLKILGEIKKPIIDLGEIKKPMIDLGLAIPKSGFNAFSEKASDISAEKALPSDFKLMLQALTPKALTQGFKVGLGDMFKELGGGIKNIGRGIKSLGSKGLTAAQRKSEEKEKESKDNKKDSFFKKQLGSTVKLLGGILKTAKLAGSAGFLALLGAGAIFALAKLIESPYWNTVAGILESGFKKIRSLFEYMDDQFGVGGIIATALALYFGPKAALTLAGKGIKALAKKLFFKGAANTLAGSAGQATGSLTKKGGLLKALGKLGMVGGVAFLAAAAVYGLIKGMQALADKNAEIEKKKLGGQATRITGAVTAPGVASGDPVAVAAAKKKVEDETRRADAIYRRTRQLAQTQANKELLKEAEKTLEVARAAQEKLQKMAPALSFGTKPAEISKAINSSFRDAISRTKFEGTAKDRAGQIKELTNSVFKKLVNSDSFKGLGIENKQKFLKSFQRQELTELNQLIFGDKSIAKVGMKNSFGLRGAAGPFMREQSKLREEQIKDPTIIKLNDELRKNTEALAAANAKNGDKGDVSVVTANSRGGDRYEYTMPPAVTLKLSSGNGQNTVYSSHF